MWNSAHNGSLALRKTGRPVIHTRTWRTGRTVWHCRSVDWISWISDLSDFSALKISGILGGIWSWWGVLVPSKWIDKWILAQFLGFLGSAGSPKPTRKMTLRNQTDTSDLLDMRSLLAGDLSRRSWLPFLRWIDRPHWYHKRMSDISTLDIARTSLVYLGRRRTGRPEHRTASVFEPRAGSLKIHYSSLKCSKIAI